MSDHDKLIARAFNTRCHGTCDDTDHRMHDALCDEIVALRAKLAATEKERDEARARVAVLEAALAEVKGAHRCGASRMVPAAGAESGNGGSVTTDEKRLAEIRALHEARECTYTGRCNSSRCPLHGAEAKAITDLLAMLDAATKRAEACGERGVATAPSERSVRVTCGECGHLDHYLGTGPTFCAHPRASGDEHSQTYVAADDAPPSWCPLRGSR